MPEFRFLDAPKDVQCAICLDPWTHPTELQPCRHIYCARCISRLNKCPECREPIVGRGTPHRLLVNMANDVKTECTSCGWQGSREMSVSHQCESEPKQAPSAAPLATQGQADRSGAVPNYPLAASCSTAAVGPPGGTRVRLYFRAEKLIDADTLSKSDPYLVLHSGVSEGMSGREIGRTEVIDNNLAPTWQTSIMVDYIFETRQEFCIKVYDDDGHRDDRQNDFLGQGTFLLSSVISARKQTFSLPLAIPRKKNVGVVHITAQEVNASARDSMCFSLQGRSLENRSKVIGSSDPYFKVNRLLPDGSKRLLYKSEVVRDNLNPTWRTVELKLGDLATDDLSQTTINIELFNDGVLGEDYMGETAASVESLMAEDGPPFQINKVRKNKPGRGQLIVTGAKRIHRPTFIEYIQAGVEINLAVSVDFTASNLDPREPNSLHSIAAGRGNTTNQYAKAISSVGDILLEYDTDKQVPAFGFGAILPSSGGKKEASHFFPLSLQEDPNVTDVSGILTAYWDALYKVKLYGPTYFAPTIRNVTNMARQSHGTYTILLILTDGDITDMDDTIDAIVAADDAPLSIVIVGIGSHDFAAMVTLDGDDDRLTNRQGRAARRDLVQFVPMRSYVNAAPGALAAEVLEEIPDQLMEWAEKFGSGHGLPVMTKTAS